VFLGLIFFGWYNITFFRFCGRVVHEYRVSDRFYLSAFPHGFCSGRGSRDYNGLAVNRVMDDYGFCFTICKGGVMEPNGIDLPLSPRCRFFLCLRCPGC